MIMQALDIGYSETMEVERFLYRRLQTLARRRRLLAHPSGKRYDDLSFLLVRLHLLWETYRDHLLAIGKEAGLS